MRSRRSRNRLARYVVGVTVSLACFMPTPESRAASEVSEQTRWGFYFNLGAGDLQGDFDSSLQKAATGEFGIVRARGSMRYGLGVSFGSFGMKPPYDHEPEWGFQRIFISGTRMFGEESSRFRPYLQGRIGIVRLHPRSLLFEKDPLPDDYEVGDSPTPAFNGVSVGLVPGLEWKLSNTVSMDVSLLLDYFHVSEVDLSPIEGGTASGGFDWQARLGVLWWTDGGPGSTPRAPDAWGVRPSYGWALGEALAINFGASALNEYVRNANFNQISPRSWWSNIEEGFTYDDNEFTTNQFIHPFNGSQYYNAARSNGLSFWPSYGIAMIGAFDWELAGETHPMSFNDLISTGIGGAAMGETMYRVSSMMLDNQATGAGRFFREAGGFIVDPIRGFNRIVSGRAWKIRSNPVDEMDTNPVDQTNKVSAGWRRVGTGGWPSLEHDTNDYGFVQYWHMHGDVFDNSRRGPFDYFTLNGQLNLGGEKTKFGEVTIRGNWLTVPIGSSDPPKHMIGVVQHFEYINNNAYEYGGQSIGAGWFSRWGDLGPWALRSRLDISATLLGAVNSDLSELATVADQERIREYDYGPGAGGNAALMFYFKGEPMLTARYQIHFLSVSNGSVYNGSDPAVGDTLGLDATHWLHGVDVRFDSPTVNSISIGAEYSSFTRESHYQISFPALSQLNGLSITELIKQTNPELRIFLTYFPGRHRESWIRRHDQG